MKTKLLILLLMQVFTSARLSAQHAEAARTRKPLCKPPPAPTFEGRGKALLTQIRKYPQWQALHQLITDECDQILDTAPVERIKIGKWLLDKSRECLRRVFMLSYAYRMTGEQKNTSTEPKRSCWRWKLSKTGTPRISWTSPK